MTKTIRVLRATCAMLGLTGCTFTEPDLDGTWSAGEASYTFVYREDGAGKTYSWGDDTGATETGESDLAEGQLMRWPDGDPLAGMMRCASLAYSGKGGGAILLGSDSLVDGAGDCPEATEPSARYNRVE